VGKSVSHTIPKYIDFSTFDQSITGGGTVYALSVIPQGNGQSQRVANTVKLKKLVFNFSIYMANTDIVTTSRLIFFRWMPSNVSTAPTVASILQNPSVAQVFSHLDFENQQQYEILWDKTFHQSGGASTPSSTSNIGKFNLVIPLWSNPLINFGNAVTTGTESLYLLSISDSSLTPFPELSFNLRVYYDDMVDDPSVKMVN